MRSVTRRVQMMYMSRQEKAKSFAQRIPDNGILLGCGN